jgi:hypothetical protein
MEGGHFYELFEQRLCCSLQQTHIDEDKQRQPWWKIRTQRASENEASKPLNHKTSFDIVQTNGDIRRPLCHVELLNDSKPEVHLLFLS